MLHRIDVTFVTNDGKKIPTKGKVGDNFLDVVVNNSLDLDGFGKLTFAPCSIIYHDFDKCFCRLIARDFSCNRSIPLEFNRGL